MATWQFDLILVPGNAARRQLAAYSSDSRERKYDLPKLWSNTDVDPQPIRDAIGDSLPARKSWSENIETWGHESETRVDLIFENGKLAEVGIRLDVREPIEPNIELVLRIARASDFLIWLDESTVILPDRVLLQNAINKSNAMRFVQNPKKFFDEL
jgi:hypothetical protein